MKIIDGASVKVMRSYDYCHFEVALSIDDGHAISAEDVDEMRKEAMRLVDKSVEQYKVAKKVAADSDTSTEYLKYYDQRVKAIKENYPKSEWTEEQKAAVKAWEDHTFLAGLRYNYEDDWDTNREENA